MTEREKLIELLQTSPTDAAGNHGVGALADHLLANGVTIQKWIPVENPPEKEGNYLVATNKGKVAESHFFPECDIVPWKRRDAVFCYPGATHWMPLPEPPKEET